MVLIVVMSFSVILSSSLFSTVYAHQDASDPTFCRTGVMKKISTVEISGESLQRMIEGQGVNCPVGIKYVDGLTLRDGDERLLSEHIGGVLTYRNTYRKHDFFDDSDARLAYGYASCVCSSMINKDIDTNNVRPLLLEPANLISEDHHGRYKLSDGITFSCNVCVKD